MKTKTEYSFATVDANNGSLDLSSRDCGYALNVDGFLAACKAIGMLDHIIRNRTLAVIKTIGDGDRIDYIEAVDVITISQTGTFDTGCEVPKRIREIIATGIKRARKCCKSAYGRRFDYDVTRGLYRFQDLSKTLARF